MKKVIQIALDDNQVIELAAILIDDDEQEALKFVKEHFKGKVRALLESG
jgi:dsRNA-specific ribonuclease